MFGVEPICRVLSGHGLKIATSTYYAAKNRAPRFCLFGQRRVQMRMPARWSAAW